MKIKIVSVTAILGVAMMSASCIPFGASQGAGILKTTNGGGDWQQMNTLEGGNANLSSTSVAVIGFDPKNSDHLFMASYDGGLYASENSAESWKQILSKIAVYDFAVSPDDSNIIYAAGFYADHGKVLVTRDGGKSWVEIYNESASQNAVRAIAINPSNSQEIYIGMSSGNIIKSTDGGTNWKLVTNFDDRVNRIRFQGNNLYILLRTKGLFIGNASSDSFRSLTESIAPSSGFGTYFSDSLPVGQFSQMAVASGNQNTIFVTAETGLYKTTDGGARWNRVPVPTKTNEVPFRAVVTSPVDDNTVYTAAGTTIYKSVDGAKTFQTQGVKGTGFVNFILAHPNISQIVYSGIYAE